jgi:hypothetical protein
MYPISFCKIEFSKRFRWTKFFALMGNLTMIRARNFDKKKRFSKAFMQESAKGQFSHDEFCEMLRE